MSHLGCIGFPQDSLAQVIDALIDRGVDDVPSQPPYRHVRSTDASGASVVVHLKDEKTVECLTPFFVPSGEPSRWRVRSSGPVVDSDCAHCGGADCDVLDADGEMITRVGMQWASFMPYRGWLSTPQDFDLEVVAFASRVELFETLAEFDAWQATFWGDSGADPSKEPRRFAENFFLPEGLFGEPGDIGQRATSLFAGRVERSERLTNTATGVEFQRVRLEVLPGFVDVVFDSASCEGTPAAGKLAVVQAWLVGRPAVPPPAAAAPKKWWQRLLG